MARVRATTLVGLTAVAATLLASNLSLAAPVLSVTNVLGPDASWVGGWNEAVVALDNKGGAFRGDVLVDASYDHRDLTRPIVRVPVTLAAGESARLILPFYAPPGGFPAVILGSNGENVDQHDLGLTSPIVGQGIIVEINGTNPMGARLVEVPPAPSPTTPPPPPTHPFAPPPGTPDEDGTPPPIAPPTFVPASSWTGNPVVSTVSFARESGDPILPDLLAAWRPATMVVVPSDVLGRLQGRVRDALFAYVAEGGTVAIRVVHEEDLRADAIRTLIGAEGRLTSTSGLPQYSGGSLKRSAGITGGDEGDVATYGLGEVWLLHRDPWARPPEPKSARNVYSIFARAYQRRESLPVDRDVRWMESDDLRKVLDPNQGFRPALGLAAVLVALYAFVVGPFAFSRARRAGRPLGVLKTAPIAALVLFVALVAIGKIGKGVRGRVRKLELVDVASGSTHATATTFHAFYVGDPSTIELVASSPLNGVHVVEPFANDSTIDLDRAGIAVRGVRAHPWQTVVLAEEGVRELDGALRLEGTGSRLTLVNDTQLRLEHVVIHEPGIVGVPPRSRYFASVAAGASVLARDGVAVDRGVVPSAVDGTAPGGANERAAAMLAAIELIERAAAGRSPFLPADRAVATVIAHPSSPAEGGFGVEESTLFIRVLGPPDGGPSSSEPPPPPTKTEAPL